MMDEPGLLHLVLDPIEKADELVMAALHAMSAKFGVVAGREGVHLNTRRPQPSPAQSNGSPDAAAAGWSI
jgi:hypothetical protein